MAEKPIQEEQVEQTEEEKWDAEQDTNEALKNSDIIDIEEAQKGDNTPSEDPDPQQAKIDALEAGQDDLKNRLLRVQADFDNFRRRTRDERVQERQFRALDIIEDLLPALDNFSRALQSKAENEETQAFKQGLDMVYRQFNTALEKEGVKTIEALNEPFDPNKHQAVMQVESADHDANIVIEVLQDGYMLNGRVIRPAMVKVSS